MTDDLAVFKKITFSEVAGGPSAACDRLPDLPAVYAFVRPIWLPDESDPDKFCQAVREAIKERAAPDHDTNVGPLHRVTLQSFSEISATKGDALRAFAQSDAFRQRLRNVLIRATPLQSPLYVGKAIKLQDRIRTHLRPMSPLARRLREVGIRIENCTLIYTVLEETANAVTDDELLLVEEILSRLLRPGFVLRIG